MAEPTQKTRGEKACDAFAAHLIANPMGGVIDGGGLSAAWSQYSDLGKAAWEAAADVIRKDAIEECAKTADFEGYMELAERIRSLKASPQRDGVSDPEVSNVA